MYCGVVEKKLDELKIKYAVVATDDRLDSRDLDKFNETERLITEGCPVIFHPVLRSQLKLLGVADIIMQNWVIAKLFNEPIKGDEYSVIDIKFSTIECDKNWNVIKTRQQAYYRGQVGFYSLMLSEMQNSRVSQGYLLGRKLKNSREVTNGAFDKLGKIVVNEVEEDIHEAIQSYRQMVQSGESNRPRPNCCNTVDYPWHGAKMQIAKETNEPSMLWNVRDSINELSKAKREIVNQIVETQERDNLIKIGKGDQLELPKGEIVFVDFETVNDVWDTFEKLPIPSGTSMIFMIGLGVIDNGRWKFYNWCVNSLDKKEEQRIVREFLKTLPKNATIVHWTNAEPMWFARVSQTKLKWFDLAGLFQSIPITVKGALNFKLKNVAKAFYNAGLISTCWSEENEVGGLGASSAAINAQQEGSFKNRWIKLTRDYNEVDTKVLYEIFDLLKFLV